MKLISFIYLNKYVLNYAFLLLMLIVVCKSNSAGAENLTYSPDQWPRHWNQLINKTRHQQQYLNGNRENNARYISQQPLRSPMWGIVPAAKQAPRRTLTPEYDTRSHIGNYYGQHHYGSRYSGFSAYGLSSPYGYGVPMMAPYAAPVLAPGLAAPGIPFGTYPYGVGFPMMGMPATGLLW